MKYLVGVKHFIMTALQRNVPNAKGEKCICVCMHTWIHTFLFCELREVNSKNCVKGKNVAITFINNHLNLVYFSSFSSFTLGS